MIEIIEKFFAITVKELYPPCGMWSLEHIIALIVTLLLIGLFVFFFLEEKQERNSKKHKNNGNNSFGFRIN